MRYNTNHILKDRLEFGKAIFISANISYNSMPETMSSQDQPRSDTGQDQEGGKNEEEVNTSALPVQDKTNYEEKGDIRLTFCITS